MGHGQLHRRKIQLIDVSQLKASLKVVPQHHPDPNQKEGLVYKGKNRITSCKRTGVEYSDIVIANMHHHMKNGQAYQFTHILIGPLPMPSGMKHAPVDEDSGSNAALEIPMKPKRSRSLTELDTIVSAEPLSLVPISSNGVMPTPEEAVAALEALAEQPQITEALLPVINMPAGPSMPQINCELYATASENNFNNDGNNIL